MPLHFKAWNRSECLMLASPPARNFAFVSSAFLLLLTSLFPNTLQTNDVAFLKLLFLGFGHASLIALGLLLLRETLLPHL